MNRYFGILLGYLPYKGYWECKLYQGNTISGSFDYTLHQILMSDVNYYQKLIGQHCCFELNDFKECSWIKLNNQFKSY